VKDQQRVSGRAADWLTKKNEYPVAAIRPSALLGPSGQSKVGEKEIRIYVNMKEKEPNGMTQNVMVQPHRRRRRFQEAKWQNIGKNGRDHKHQDIANIQYKSSTAEFY
jgi:hypothetical protein